MPARWRGRDGAARRPYQSAPPRANRAAAESEKFCQRVWMGSATSRSIRPSSSKAPRKFQATSLETQRQSSIDATQDRKWRRRSLAHSREQTCAEDAANKNKAVAADESFRQNAQQIHASRP